MYARASGDGKGTPNVSRFCRLCGKDDNLRRLRETCCWDGIEEEYGNVLADCFGVRVSPSDGLICSHCISQLRATQKFRTLVLAAFDFDSDNSSMRTAISIHTHKNMKKDVRKSPTLPFIVNNCSLSNASVSVKKLLMKKSGLENAIKTTKDQIDVNKKILEMLSKKAAGERQKRLKPTVRHNYVTKRTIIVCTGCGQKYPMITAAENPNKFICSRCKLKTKSDSRKKRHVSIPMATVKEQRHEQQAQRSKVEHKSKSGRLNSARSSLKRKEVDCTSVSQSLVTNRTMKSSRLSHKLITPTQGKRSYQLVNDNRNPVCHKDMQTRPNVEQPRKLRKGHPTFPCDSCNRVYKSRHALQSHYGTHLQKS